MRRYTATRDPGSMTTPAPARPKTRKTSPRWRQTVVWLHVVSSIAWLSQAAGLTFLGVLASTAATREVRVSAASMAELLDAGLLAPLANAAAFTGLLLAGATAWGFFRHWWVLIKFVLTFAQLYAGIFLFSPALKDSVEAARAGDPHPVGWPMIAGGALMASALAFQAWLSVTKVGKRTRWSPAAKPGTAPTWVFVAGVVAVVTDLTVAVLIGVPAPACSVIMLVVLLSVRGKWLPRRVSAQVLQQEA